MSWTPGTTGAHTLTARATDNCGIATTSAAVTVTINPAGTDTQPPTVTITAPSALASDLNGSITFSADATDNVGVASVEFQVDGVTVGAPTPRRRTAPASTPPRYASGQHVLRARASDAAGNQSAWVDAHGASSAAARTGAEQASRATRAS